MKYETVGGKTHDTNHNKITIRELKLGDKFQMQHSAAKYSVIGEKCIWSSSGQSTRKCRNLYTSAIEFKRCNTEIIKLP